MGSNFRLFKKLDWYKNRLKCMSFPEVLHRLHSGFFLSLQSIGFFSAKKVPAPNLIQRNNSWVGISPQVIVGKYCHAADEILAGYLDVFAMEKVYFGHPPQWNREPKSFKSAPLRFGKFLDYRDLEKVGDIKYLWEPNRHLHLVTLAQAYYLSRSEKYLEGIRTQLNSWFEQCPYPKGLQWNNSLELGIRLLNWSLVWNMIGGLNSDIFKNNEGEQFLNSWLSSIYQHCHFIRNDFSRFSSANNHLIGEAAGLFVATCTWPFWDKFPKWRDLAYQELVNEAQRQNYPDGVNKEQSTSYQQFVIDFLMFSALVGRANGIEFHQPYWDRLEAMMDFLSAVMNCSGDVPMLGDADDGYVTRLSQDGNFNPFRSLLASGAILFNRGDFKLKAGGLDDKTRWLFGADAETRFAAVESAQAEPPRSRAFPEGGYYLLGWDFEGEKEIRLVADAGPLGYLSLAAHGHADALAMVLSVGGREILIDPGTFAYHTQGKWRGYFRGTGSHNTLRIDEQDQSVSGGNFLWLKQANASCQLWRTDEEQDLWIGVHDGYGRLADPVRHMREICLRKREGKIVVTDILECKGSHLVERFWHFSENCRVTQVESRLVVENKGVEVHFLPLSDGGVTALCRGESFPPCGWVSRRYDFKEPILTAVFRNNIKGNTRLTTEIVCTRYS